MKVRKLAVALALAGGLGSGLAQALGMGEGRILTNLNEPLRAEIELSEPGDLSADQIKVSLAPESAFERAGLRRMDVLHGLEFDVIESDGGFRIDVTSEDPIREPFLNFLVELTWPNGRLLREYSFLVDPPSRDPGQEAIGPSAETGEGDTRSREQAAPESQRESRQGERAAASTDRAPDEYGPTGANDTLWGIAGEVSPSSDLSRHQVMLAIQEANPDAFGNNNINQLRRGRVLRIPSEEAMRSRSRQEAIQQVMAQNERHQQAGQRQAETAAAPEAQQAEGADGSRQQAGAAGQQASSGDNGDELRILVADGENSEGDGTMAGMGDGEGDERLAAALEELDRAERDREELSSRLKDLEEQLNTMSQLIELKDDQLAEMEQRLAEARESDQASGDTESEDTGGGETAEGETAQPEGGGASDESESQPEASSEASTAEPDAAGAESGEDGTGDDDGDPAAAAGSGGDPDDGDASAQTDPEQTQGQGAPTSAGDVVQRVINDPRYQIGAGVLGIALLALLWGLARRNAAREQAFYDQLKDVSENAEEPLESEETLDLDAASDEVTAEAADEEAAPRSEGSEDALAEADVYLAYGRHGQAARHLEEAISTEPSRVDLRLKLLGVYADAGESENFEKQYRELSAFNDDEAIEQADALRSRLDAADEDLSIEDLAEQLKTGTGSESDTAGQSPAADDSIEDEGFDFSALEDVDDLLDDSSGSQSSDAGQVESREDQNFQSEEFSLDFDLGEEETPAESETTGAGEESVETGDTSDSEEDVADLGFSMDDLELEEPEEESVPELDAEAKAAEEPVTETGDTTEQADDSETDLGLDDLELELETEEEPAETTSDASSGADFDDSFLEELDAELDRVTDGEAEAESAVETASQPGETATQESADELDDLSLDVPDEDLELAEEVAQEGVGEEPEAPGDTSGSSDGEEEAPADQLEESLMDSEMEDLGAESALSDEELAALEGEEPQRQQEEAGDMEPDGASTGSEDSDDEFDFLEGTDEAGTKLDLARAYVEMGDADGARDILEEVAREGSDEQQQEAQRLLSEL
ncbi:FimV/HubP family polar landmark protein [Vreelandella utahensis]|uniref:FimV/HubP family polar landmark protein n=1 Tax=Vreelandella halophila TaxID=86177 RepID=UPI00098522C6|nr:FimV/HubP family polar landmark protein [Halomonas utahensis]